MSGKKPQAPLPQSRDGAEAFHDDFEKLHDALERLYISGNISGRIRFAKEWPVMAERILGEELLQYDSDGQSHKEILSNLEDEAEKRRIEMLYLLEDVRKKSIVSGVLEKGFVSKVIDKLGPEISKSVYAPEILGRIQHGLDQSENQKGATEKEAASITPSKEPDLLGPSSKQERTVNNPALSGSAPSLTKESSRVSAQNPALNDEEPKGEEVKTSKPQKPAFNLGRKKRLVQIAPVKKKAISYKDLVADSAGDEGADNT